MDRVVLILEADSFHNRVKELPAPVNAIGICNEDGPDVVLVYEDLEAAAIEVDAS